MSSFIKFLMNSFKKNDIKEPISMYDIDGNYLDPHTSKLSDDELMIPAEKARMMHSKAMENARIKARKQVFSMIHKAIRNGKMQLRLETYHVNDEILTHLDTLGYTVENVVPPDTGLNAQAIRFSDDDDDEPETPEAYHYYIIRWGDTPAAMAETPVSFFSVDRVADAVTMV